MDKQDNLKYYISQILNFLSNLLKREYTGKAMIEVNLSRGNIGNIVVEDRQTIKNEKVKNEELRK